MISRHRSKTAAGRAAEPETIRRSRPAASDIETRPGAEAFSHAAISFTYAVGTAMKSVTPPATNRSHTASASNRGSISHVAPEQSEHNSAFTIPCV